jgi:Zn-dependent protease with chaperone function
VTPSFSLSLLFETKSSGLGNVNNGASNSFITMAISSSQSSYGKQSQQVFMRRFAGRGQNIEVHVPGFWYHKRPVLAACLFVLFGGILSYFVYTFTDPTPYCKRRRLIWVPLSVEKFVASSMIPPKDAQEFLEMPYLANPEVVEAVGDIVQRLVTVRPEFANMFEWTVFVVEDDHTMNAACLPGGIVVVWSGLLRLLSKKSATQPQPATNDGGAEKKHTSTTNLTTTTNNSTTTDDSKKDDIKKFQYVKVYGGDPRKAKPRLTKDAVDLDLLAAVLAHEIGHGIARHGAEYWSVFTPLAFFLLVFGANYMQGIFHYLLALPHSRKKEHEADIIGLHLMAEAGYDPKHVLRLMEKFMELPEQPFAYLSTHPSGKRRCKKVEEALQKLEKQNQAEKEKENQVD